MLNPWLWPFTFDLEVNEAEQANLALFVSLGGVGLSLINSLYEEVAFMTLSGSSALWEVEVKNKWKSLNMELASWLEEKWRNDENKVILEDFVEVVYFCWVNHALFISIWYNYDLEPYVPLTMWPWTWPTLTNMTLNVTYMDLNIWPWNWSTLNHITLNLTYPKPCDIELDLL